MTAHVAQINEKITRENIFQKRKKDEEPEEPEEPEDSNGFRVGELVVCRATEKQMRIYRRHKDKKYTCTIGGQIVGSYFHEELMSWNEWLEIIGKQ